MMARARHLAGPVNNRLSALLRQREILDLQALGHIFRSMTFAARLVLILLLVFILPLAAHALWWSARDDVASSRRARTGLREPAASRRRDPQAVVHIYAAVLGAGAGFLPIIPGSW
jgi:hypothetical protein